jgi:predicted nucleic acid-binding protein
MVREALEREPGALVVPAPVTAEVDYLLGQRLGRAAQTAFLADIASGSFEVACLDAAEYAVVVRYEAQYADLSVGLADLSVVLIAHRWHTRRIMTFDYRHFRALSPLDGGSFFLVPDDEPRAVR